MFLNLGRPAPSYARSMLVIFTIIVWGTSSAQKKALVIGASGQDGFYITELLLEKGYQVYGTQRRTVGIPEYEQYISKKQLELYQLDITDTQAVAALINQIRPNEIYNLAAQSHVQLSFDKPVQTMLADALGVYNLLEGIRSAGLIKKVKFYQASTSELFGKAEEIPQRETTPFHPCSPYAVAKLCAYWATVNYREAYGLFACNGILFNHESPRRGIDFVTRKITRAIAAIKYGLQNILFVGNLDAQRDWGCAKDYVEAMWLMLQHDQPSDYVVATGEAHSVREFIQHAFKFIDIDIVWHGTGLNEEGIDKATGVVRVKVDKQYFRPLDRTMSLGDPTKAKQLLGWFPTTPFATLIKTMVDFDCQSIKSELGKTAQT